MFKYQTFSFRMRQLPVKNYFTKNYDNALVENE